MIVFATDTLAHVAQQLGLVAGILIALGVIGRAAQGGWKMVRRLVEALNRLEAIYEQFLPNEGHSLTDRVLRIDENVQRNARNIETVYGIVLKGHDVDPAEAPLLEVPTFETDDDAD